MTDKHDNLVLTLLRAIRIDTGEITADLHESKIRLGLIESQYASLSRRIDRMGEDIQRIKRRLDITEADAT